MTKTWDSPQEGHRSRQSRDGRWGWKEENILALTSRSAFTRHSVQSLVPGVGRRCWGQIALTHRWHWAWPRRVPSPMDKTVSLLVGCSRSNRGGLFHKINFQATYWLNCAGISEVHHAVPNYKPSHQNVECFLTNSWLLGHWMGRFLLQALDWIQETGEYYLSTHTSPGETAEETQELLKEYGEFRVPAKVGSIPEPSPSTQHSPVWPISHCGREDSLCTQKCLTTEARVGDTQVGSSPLRPERPKRCSCW